MHTATHTVSMGTMQSLSVADAIHARRAVKVFDPDHKMTGQETERLMSLAALAPTAFNIQNWRFVLLRDPVLRKQVRALAWDQSQVTDASLLIVLCADLKAWEKEPLTIEQVLNARMVSYPFTVRDCCLVLDGGGAMILTSAARAKSLRKKPVYVLGTGEALSHASISRW